MAERRMFTDKITESDAFLDMPLSTQALYFHLCMNADDDGFVKNPKRIQKMLGSNDDDIKLLIIKRFVLPFESGVIVIKHWRMHNLLRKDRYKPTEYIEEKSILKIKENGAYTFDENQGKPLMATNWQPNDNQLAPQDSIGKDSIDKNNIYIYSSFENEQCIEKIKLDKNNQDGTLSHKSPDIISISYSISNYNNIYEELLDFLNNKLSTNKKGFRKETQEIINEQLESGVTVEELKKRIEKAPIENFNLNESLLSDEEQILNYWNSKKIIKHTFNDKLKKVISKSIKEFGFENLKIYIDRYNTVLTDSNYYFNYKWTLEQFLKRKEGISSFKDDGDKWVNYQSKPSNYNSKNKTQIISHNYTAEKLNSVYDNLDDIEI